MNSRIWLLPFWSLLLAGFVYGCASRRHEVVLDPVGPAPGETHLQGSNGFLVVYSALDSRPVSTDSLYRDRYTGYTIKSADDREILKKVRNDNGRLLGNPEKVELPVGTYRVQAEANGYGQVEVPVTIKPHQVTAVHLEGAFWWPRASQIFESDPVRLPRGEIVGWRATAP